MVIRETPTHFICIAQHDHGLFSGWLAERWGNDNAAPRLLAPGNPLLLAAQLHEKES